MDNYCLSFTIRRSRDKQEKERANCSPAPLSRTTQVVFWDSKWSILLKDRWQLEQIFAACDACWFLRFLTRNLNLNSFGHSEHLVCIFLCIINTAWKVSKYRVFSGPYFPAFRLNTICKCLLIFGRCFIFWNIFHGQNDHFELYILSLVSSDNNFLGAWMTVAISSYLNDFAGIITIHF